MEKDLVCPICGEATYIHFGNPRRDRLCRKHGMMEHNGEISQCEKCGKWNKAEENCSCKKEEIAQEQNKTESATFSIDKIKIEKASTCITCGYPTDKGLFCKKCYYKYKNKDIIIKIRNCKEIVPLDDFYEGHYVCDDGHVVKSMAEREIDNFLFQENINHGYEIEIRTKDQTGKMVTLHPDFCIFDDENNPQYYIEYWGYDDNNWNYQKTKKYKMPIYEALGITLINVNAKTDLKNIKASLRYKLNPQNYEIGKPNFIDE